MIHSVGHRLRVHWRTLSMGSTNRRIFGAAVTVGALTLVAAIATMGKELLVAAFFGTSDALDAFLIAFLLPSFIITVLAGSFSAALVPTYIQVREHEGQPAAQRLLSGVLALGLVLLLAVVAMLFLAAPLVLPLLGSSFNPAKLLLTERLFYVLLPIILISGMTTILSAILNADEHFALAAFTPALVPLAAAVALLALRQRLGIYALASGTVAGYGLQLVWLGRALGKHGISVWPRWRGLDAAMRKVIGQYVPMVAGAALMSGTFLVDQSIAVTAGSGSVSALVYGNKLVALAFTLGATAVRTAVLPYFARMVAGRDWDGVRRTLGAYTRLIVLGTIPVTLLLFVFALPLVRLLYERGAFTAEDAHLVAQVQAMYALQLPFYVMGSLLTPLISSFRENRILMWAAVINLPLNIGLDLLFLKFLGVKGIALSTAVVYVISCAYLVIQTYRVIRLHEGEGIRTPAQLPMLE